MNGDMLLNSHSITLRNQNHSKSKSPSLDEMTIKLIQEGKYTGRCSIQNDAQRQGDVARKLNSEAAFVLKLADREESHSQRPCRTEEHQAPQQLLHFSPVSCLHAPSEHSSPPAPSNITHTLLANSTAVHLANQRRDIRRKAKGKKSTLRMTESGNSQNRKVTDYYPIRRSSRKSRSELKCEQKKHIDDLIINGVEEGMEVQHIDGKGRGVFATQCFQKGQYVVEYHGDLLQITDAKTKEAEYALNPTTGCYMYYFQYICKTYCVDATKETGRMGRLINHSKNGNCQTKLHDINGIPHLILVASRDVDEGEELLYDYGDRSKSSIASHPWLKH
ncbi:N-lysine methyltransferase KMT5A-A-like isoform X1 [Oncorhynchus kisutch]|uniref:[histone H4]-lysine(20) N-methyltransferase n=1 Tax=Oncorhynchus kisutch TaxID=8019 RepID=A0A8C7CIC3_ONCKI|nr:N-lysine methyltransferase KMT5A-A-like isoform X1 [Oncorhynchus kisutch]